MRKGKLLGIILMKAFRIRTGKYDEESGIFPGFPTEETAVQNMISIMELHWRIWNPESSYDSEEKSFGQIPPCFPPCRMPGNGGIPALAVETFRSTGKGKCSFVFCCPGLCKELIYLVS
ncbi:hypothetical protein F1985_08685 [Akkermansia sp. BIOML-A41]|jgi:hypothetical protein|uniref:hypothetical protein n=2 Tax=unclassified Akkermansia TaxID=2608915 RepID=UPI00122F314B|nr:hypothetical protein [Akkermansia sp. BIOML-A34]KAA3167511.1 hypothetical protein F2A23_00355 [Akkermansia sp. BIOML-A63]KAA3198174.1 hypothetical protein F2A00_01595 [Akkermansia sp. BIOML-A48]KAA3203681.1 hypothetical protein F1987_03140 [Akkermansia sp. BIOML-A47]KAA3222410.1 hypothetical protein F1985_08685 [Akkermansia sp. BIOML-A41]KAA3243582.1 hypothetical protein F1971_01575 [Akkermansia sp. BIOML-A40]KAA3267049.1 hypothetical protein F1953_00640 [Akkermansia sp. BIOML-A22]KAA3299